MSDPKHTFSVEDDGSVRIEMPSGVGVDVNELDYLLPPIGTELIARPTRIVDAARGVK